MKADLETSKKTGHHGSVFFLAVEKTENGLNAS